jgi:NAD(P)H-quinone oxidoreductase subunit 6
MDAGEIVLNVIFYALAAAAIAGAVAVATSKNIVRSAFALLAVLFSAAALYAVMKADFIAAAQVLIYVGGILVLIIFAVMLTHRITDVKLSNDSTPGPAAFCACLCLLFSLVVVILFTAKWERKPLEFRTIAAGTEVFLSQYQADGSTGLERGASAFEDTVIIAVRVDRPLQKVELVEVVAWQGEKENEKDKASEQDKEKEKDKEKAKEKDKEKPKYKEVTAKAVFDPGVTRIQLENLAEGEWRWKAILRGPDGDSEVSSPAGKADFVVYRGITEPVAMALAGPYLFAFEVVSVLLLAALVGAAFLARKEVREA